MRLPIDWLKDFVKIKKSPDKLAEDLTLFGHEVGLVEKFDDDFVLDIEITPNRGDCLSILGIARELSSLYNLKITPKNHAESSMLPSIRKNVEILDKGIKIEITEPRICPRFTARIIDGVKIGPSPKWMKRRLIAYGLRPINNVVDITNYVMIERGQPLHAFDYQKIAGRKMIVRRGKKGESVVTLDGIRRDLDEEAIVIQDTQKLIDLAGIMGGQNSEISEKTETIVLQAAIFDPILIRRTSKKLNLSTEASYRYERGVDFQGTISALNYATSLVLLIASGRASKIVDIQNIKWQPIKIKWQPEKDVERILGIKIKRSEILRHLEKLGIKCLWCSRDGQTCQVEIPSFRQDLKIPEDLIEEVARLYGYWRLPKTILFKQKKVKENKEWIIEQKIKDFLVDLGFVEVESYPYLSVSDLENVGLNPGNCLEIANPISPETQFLRPSLFPSILRQIAKNPWAPEIKIFEIGKVFEKNTEKKQIVIASTIPLEKISLKLEEVAPEILKKFKIRKKIYLHLSDFKDFVAKVSLPTFYNTDFPKVRYRPISSFPPAVFDLAIVVNEEIDEKEVEEVIKKSSSLVFDLELFDIYTGPPLAKRKKSLAYHLTLSSYNHTLKDEEIKKVRQSVISNLKKKLGASIRGESV